MCRKFASILILLCYDKSIDRTTRTSPERHAVVTSKPTKLMKRIFLGDVLMAIGLSAFLAVTAARFSDKYMGTAIKQTGYQIGGIK